MPNGMQVLTKHPHTRPLMAKIGHHIVLSYRSLHISQTCVLPVSHPDKYNTEFKLRLQHGREISEETLRFTYDMTEIKCIVP